MRLTIFPLQSPRQKDYCQTHFHCVDPQTQSLRKCSCSPSVKVQLVSWIIYTFSGTCQKVYKYISTFKE